MFDVTPIPAFNDNYIWALSVAGQNQIAVVDPGDATPVENYLRDNDLQLAAILVTHHHHDHTGGIQALRAEFDVPVYGPEDCQFSGITHTLADGATINLFGHALEIRAIPGHTLDHISYFSAADTPQIFCGDTLFLAGCGRLFEGTPSQMFDAMAYFKSLPDATEIYCTHEYSMANLKFAAAVEPDNTDIEATLSTCYQLREADQPTLPTSIAQERRINPFLRTDSDTVIRTASDFSGRALNTELDVFTAVREWKNQF